MSAPAAPPRSSASVFRVVKQVRFADVDAGGIVFFPRYFEILNEVVEDWFAQALGASFSEMLARRRGVPTVRIEADFLSPGRLGEQLEFALEVLQLGRSSITLAVSGHHGETCRVSIRQTLVFMDLDRERATPLPAELRTAMAPYVHEEV